ncbi:Splicing factor [Tulasnella sp. 425]|nr:Splicing factor [Tulasnella sp. 425]
MSMDVDQADPAMQALEALPEALTAVQETPLAYTLHYRALALLQAIGMEDQLEAARNTLTNYLAVADDIWIPLLESKIAQTNVPDVEIDAFIDVEEMFMKAERDYLSIPIFKVHLEYLIRQVERAASGSEALPEGFLELYATESVSARMRSLAAKAEGHLARSHEIWDIWMEWELERHDDLPQDAKYERFRNIPSSSFGADKLVKGRTCCHANTYQNYSMFVSKCLSDREYESAMQAATEARQEAVATIAEREAYEMALTSLPGYTAYISWEEAPKKPPRQRFQRGRNQPKPQDIPPNPKLVIGLYERAIAEAASQRAEALSGGDATAGAVVAAEAWLASFWDGLTSFLRESGTRNKELECQILERAVRSVPASGTLWASRIRALDFFSTDDDEASEDISTIVNYALESGVLDATEITSVAVAAAAYESHQLSKEEPGNSLTARVFMIRAVLIRAFGTDVSAFERLRGILESAITKSRAKGGDESLKLEKFLVYALVNFAGLADDAIEVWESASKFYKSKYYVWTEYTSFLTHRLQQYEKARTVYKNASTPSRTIDYPQAIWNAWVAFEEIHGTVDQLEHALKRVRKMTQDLTKKAAQRLMRWTYPKVAGQQAKQVGAQEFLDEAVAPQTTESAAAAPAASEQGSAMVVDEQAPSGSNQQKRKAAEEEPLEQPMKRAKPDNEAPLKRDRENSTVFVAGLQEGLKDDELKRLFKDCGEIREVKISKLPNDVVATVEFMDRESVPAALTKDKKRIQGNEIAVFLAWRSTLYVTNFPEKADDVFIRDLFGAHGTIFDVRWPSKKFKATRRFCYVQFTLPDSAQAALELNGRELEPDMALNVYISNPQRKKERTDANVEQREIYVAGLAKSTKQNELEELFGECGPIKGVRLPLDDKGKAKGFAFVEFEHETSALAALQLNNREVKKRRIAVTMVDPRAPGRKEQPSSGLGKRADLIARSVRIKKVPSGTEEGLLQQAIEKVASGVKRVEIFKDTGEATVEFDSMANAAKLLLETVDLTFQGAKLELTEESQAETPSTGATSSKAPARPGNARPSAPAAFVPRAAAVPKPKARLGIGAAKANAAKPSPHQASASGTQTSSATATAGSSTGGKNQDAFRAMLGGGKK